MSMIQDLVNSQIKQNESQIRETIRDRWVLGKLPDGSSIAKYSLASSYEVNRKAGYAKYYVFKHDLNKKAGLGNVDLTLTGALGKGIKVKVAQDNFEIFSTDEKFEDIISRYGDYNFNLSEDEKKELFDNIINNVINIVLNQIYE
jgi:hypothetical protein